MRSHALLRLRSYVKPHAKALVLAIALAFVEIYFETRIPDITRKVIDGPIRHESQRGRLLPLIGLLTLFGVLEVILAYRRRKVLSNAALRVETDVRNDLYAHLQRLHIGFHDGWQSGQLLSRCMQDINSLRRFVGFCLPFLVILSFQFVYTFVLMFKLSPVLAFVAAVGILPVGWISYTMSRQYRVIARRIQDQQGDLGTIIEESATGIRIIKAFGRAPLMRKKFRLQAEKLRESSLGWVRLMARLWPMFDVFPNLVLGAVLIVGGRAVIRGDMSLGSLWAFILYVQMLIWPVDALGWILAMTEESRTSTERLMEVFDTQPQIADRPGAVELVNCEGRIAMNDVWFRYEGGTDWVLRGVNLEIAPGETLALVGKTGCGKSTLAMLIPRLYDVDKGTVTLDGRDVSSITVGSLRSHVGVAFEDPILFSASVRENLVMGRLDVSDHQITLALETAQASFVNELPYGLDTRVGEQGHTLSGGQRQRLALARAVLGGPRVLVLDDPLSSVDVHTEALIETALETVLEGTTAILVVHRPSTLALADRVALLDEGRIVAVGTHHELMESEPLYRAVLSQEAEEYST
ncbi:MAG: ABC transporter ATP-binding protein [Actinomycetota bacterium]